jgi:hypothetical protein
VRQYGPERLVAASEEGPLRGHHRDVFLALAEEAAPHRDSGRQREWLEVLDPAVSNLATAIDLALRWHRRRTRAAGRSGTAF